MRILVVDDDMAGRQLIAAIFRSAGHDVLLAKDGAEALDIAHQKPPGLVLTDILMPRMDGYQLARAWKADPALAGIPLVFLTASYTDHADEKFAIELGADGFLRKPVETDVLLATIEEVTRGVEDHQARSPLHRTETDTLREYSERVVRKLEQKVDDLERSHHMLEFAMKTLSDEVETKERLIEELGSEIARRKVREAELRHERDFNAALIETTDVFICSSDAEGQITLFSPGAERISGYYSNETLGRDIIEMFAPNKEHESRRELEKSILAAGQAVNVTSAWVMSSGEERILDWAVAVTRDESGHVNGVIRFGIDVTDRVHGVAAERVMGAIDLSILLDRPVLEMLAAMCAQAVEEFGLGVVWVAFADEDGHLELHAGAGSSADDVIAEFARDSALLCPAGDLAALTQPVILRSGTEDSTEAWETLAKVGTLRSAGLYPIRAHGAVRGVLGAMAYSERALEGSLASAMESVAGRLGVGLMFAETHERLRLQSAALESAGNTILITDAIGCVQWANLAFTDLTGYGVEEVIGRRLFAAGDGYLEPGYRDVWDSVLAGHRWQGETVNRARDGAEYAEIVTLAPVKGGDGLVTHVVIVKADVSERRRFEQLQRDFVARVSHELRTPLTTIVGFADILSSDSLLSQERSSAAIGGIREAGGRMRGLVEELLLVTQMQVEGIDVKPELLHIGGLVHDLAVRVVLDQNRRLAVSIPEYLPPVLCDSTGVTKALYNILHNAVKYSPAASLVSVSARINGNRVSIAVKDEGIGIAQNRLTEILEAFTQAEMSSTRSFGGFGLGLFVAQRLIAANGGEITVESQLGVGSTFEIHLPYESEMSA